MAKFVYSRNVKLLAAVSFFTDVASEMLYPIMPLLWASLGFSVQMIGVIEGLSEAISGLSKLLWGWMADRFKKYRFLVILGYGISAVAKPLLGITSLYYVALASRGVERLGKAIRTAPRDAILAAESEPADRPRVIGFHRSMDTLGAVVGPAICLLLLYLFNGNLRNIFIIAAIPGLFAVLAAIAVNDRKVNRTAAPASNAAKPRVPLREVWQLPAFRKLAVGLALFSLVNSSDMFLILRLRELGINNTHIVLAYMFYNAVYAVFAKVAYRLVLKVGLKGGLLASLFAFALVYGLLSFNLGFAAIFATLLLYGLFAGVFEVTSKAWIVNIVPAGAKATGVGLVGTITSLGFLVSSVVTGFLWQYIGSGNALATLAVGAVVPIIYFIVISISERARRE